MPIYEYFCQDCKARFDALRAMSDADSPILCVECHSDHTSRTISLFAAHSENRVLAGNGSGCATCSSGTCSTCRT